MTTIFAIDGADNFDFGAASSAVAELQTALVALGKGVGDNTLKAIVVDGLIGPKTATATNRALTMHVGAGQAPASLRTGALTQAQVASDASTLATIVNDEARRRGSAVPTSAVIATVAKTTAPKSTAMVPYTPPAATPTPIYPTTVAPGGFFDNRATIIKWSAIGLGLVVATSLAYWFMRRRRAPGFGSYREHVPATVVGEGAHGLRVRTPDGIFWLRRSGKTYNLRPGDSIDVSYETEDQFVSLDGSRRRGGLGGCYLGSGGSIDNRERELWINNDEGLYNWYQRESRHQKGGMRAFIQRNKDEIDAAIRSVRDRPPQRGFGGATEGLVEVIRYQGGLIVVHHHGMKSKRIGHYYADVASHQAAVKQAKAYAKKVRAEYADNS